MIWKNYFHNDIFLSCLITSFWHESICIKCQKVPELLLAENLIGYLKKLLT